MRRVVVTGLGIVSSIGNDQEEVTASLRDARSGISFSPEFAEHGFKCQVWGRPTGIAVAQDGALLVSDDSNGTIFRVTAATP